MDPQDTSTSTTGSSSAKIQATLDRLFGKLDNTIKQGAPAPFDQSLYSPVGSTTQSGWASALARANDPAYGSGINDAMGFESSLLKNGGFSGNQQGNIDMVNGLVGQYGQLGANGGLTPEQQAAQAGLGGVAAGYQGTAGLTPEQQAVQSGLRGVGTGYASIGANGGLTPGQTRNINTTDVAGAGFGSLTQNGGLTTGQRGNVNDANSIAGGFGALTRNGGLTGSQSGNLGALTNIGADYSSLSNAYSGEAPGYAALRAKAGDDALSSINSVFNSNGRFGGGSNVKAAGEGVASALSGLDYANFTNNINNQYRSLDSQSGIQRDQFGMEQTGVGNQVTGLTGALGASGEAFNRAQTGIGNQVAGLTGQLGAANQSFGQRQQGTSNYLSSLAGQNSVLDRLFGNSQTGTGNTVNALAGQGNTFNSIFGNSQAGVGNQFGALAGAGDAAGTAYGLEQGGINNRQTAATAFPALFQSSLLPSGVTGAVGAAQDANNQGILQGQYDLSSRLANNKTDWLSKLFALGSSGAAAGGTTTTSTTPGTPWWQSALGLGIAGGAAFL